ncbi:MMPL family transporter [Nocardioides guangzhouensis]|uniref:MMPL family transporter n=1 Tax=Nocardioides guangzhouensis TaxID=2497878 RepID=A0A4Q4ZG86_9ACTN|nr:MMPL family transporter [Nocardioides guangzhouensis]RYP86446.1 MMPL family transporter [Nocardioides guangzhouensis]
MSRFLHRLGRGAALHPWRTLAAWVLASAIVFGIAGSFGGTPVDNWDVPGAPAQKGVDTLRAHVPGAGNASAQVVVHGEDGQQPSTAQLDRLTAALLAMDHAVTVTPPRMSDDGDTAMLVVGYDEPVTHPDLMENLEPLEDAVAGTRDAGFQVEFGGELPGTAAAPMEGYGELIGVVAALLILLLAFGSVIGAGLPVGVALIGLVVGSAGLTILAGTMDVSTAAPMVASMVGLGVGIDYALLLVTRHVEFLRRGLDVPEAAGRAVATAGRSVVFASATVLVSLMGLRLAGLSTYSSFGFATAIAVVTVAAAALTLVPVFARFAGHRLLPRRVRKGRESTKAPLTARWAQRVAGRPLPWAIGAALLMIVIALPALGMRTWPQDASSQSTETTTRRAFDLVSDEFGPGANGPLTVVLDREKTTPEEAAQVAADLEARDDIVAVTPPVESPDKAILVFDAEPAFGPSDERTARLVDEVRRQLPDGAQLTGTTAMFSDIAEMLAERLWLVIAFVVLTSVLVLAMVFRSVLVPLKAAVMNLLSIGAAYGVLVAVFQWGWGVELLGLDHAMPVSSWVPILIFAILFGLSMDYEVFLLSRVRESWLDTGDAHASVIRGLSDTGRVISSAAAIMVAVFLGFATEVDVVVKMLGLGMATAIFLDATVVRMVLVPATMALLGKWNWWVPAWLDRVLPTIDVEAELVELEAAATTDDDTDTDETEPGLAPAGR